MTFCAAIGIRDCFEEVLEERDASFDLSAPTSGNRLNGGRNAGATLSETCRANWRTT